MLLLSHPHCQLWNHHLSSLTRKAVQAALKVNAQRGVIALFRNVSTPHLRQMYLVSLACTLHCLHSLTVIPPLPNLSNLPCLPMDLILSAPMALLLRPVMVNAVMEISVLTVSCAFLFPDF